MKKNIFLMGMLFPCIVSVITFNEKEKPGNLGDINPFENASFSAEAYCSQSGGWGYEIYVNGKLFLQQDEFSSDSGVNMCFEKEEEAVAAAIMAIHNIRNHITPPYISPDEPVK